MHPPPTIFPFNLYQAGWLMLAYMYIGTGKYDLAEELCQRCLNYNQGCGLAHERMGLIKEKEASYADAAEHYEAAWVCDGVRVRLSSSEPQPSAEP